MLQETSPEPDLTVGEGLRLYGGYYPHPRAAGDPLQPPRLPSPRSRCCAPSPTGPDSPCPPSKPAPPPSKPPPCSSRATRKRRPHHAPAPHDRCRGVGPARHVRPHGGPPQAHCARRPPVPLRPAGLRPQRQARFFTLALPVTFLPIFATVFRDKTVPVTGGVVHTSGY